MAASVAPTIALANLIIDITNKLHIPNNIFLRFKHHLILKYIENKYKSIIDEYKRLPAEVKAAEDNQYLWVFWWQGLQDAPELVKRCISSVQGSAPPHKQIVVIDKYNYMQWLKINPLIIRKVESGLITLTHFSDIIRMGLLSQYGGLWLDATIYAGHPIPESIWEKEFYSNRTSVTGDHFVSKGEWSGFLIGGCNLKLFRFCSAIFEQYWIKHDILIDYFFLDYCIKLAAIHFNDIYEMIRKSENNDDIYKLQSIMNLPYEASVYTTTLEDNLYHKLNRKETFLLQTPSGAQTTYSVWITSSPNRSAGES